MEKVITRRRQPERQIDAMLHPLLNRLYGARGIESVDDLERELKNLENFHQLIHIDKAVGRLYQALIKQEKIIIVGDFDTDGATSSAVAVRCLTLFGAQQVDYMVPNRFTDGYGLTPGLVEQAHAQQAELIVTVDNGISSHAGVERANQLDIDVIVTDHHLPPDQLPDAYAIVNPNQVGDPFESKAIAGVGVIFYVMLALRRQLVDTGWFQERKQSEPNMSHVLDLVALGTIADVVPLDKNNRILVHQGLKRIKAGRACAGINALLEVGNRNPTRVCATDLAYAVAPRLNAAGRLEDMRLGIACLLSDNMSSARHMAKQLDELNIERKQIESDMQAQAFNAIAAIKLNETQLPNALCLYHDDWHQGVIGIIAGRVKDRVHRPTIAFAKVSDDELKGSARSINGCHIRDLLAHIDGQHPGLIVKFGGHAMAAGLSLSPANYASFKEIFTEQASQFVDETLLRGELVSDGELDSNELNLEVAELLREAGPWGQQFPEPLFDGDFRLLDQRIVGHKHLKLVLGLPNSTQEYDAIAFNVDLEQWPDYRRESVHIAYRIDVNEFRQRRQLQLIIEHMV